MKTRFRVWCIGLALFMLLGGALPAFGQAEASEVDWELRLPLEAYTALGGGTQAWLQDAAISTGPGGLLSGSTDLAGLRSLLFDQAEGAFNLLNGKAEVVIRQGAGESLSLQLQAHYGTGYQWEVVDEAGLLLKEGYTRAVLEAGGHAGAPGLVAFHFEPAAASRELRLRYARWFESEEPTARTLSITLPSGMQALKLTDPTPPAMNVVSETEEHVPLEGDVSSDIERSGAAEGVAVPAALPARWDWREHGIVPPVRRQGSCGSCWAFGTVGIFESALAKAGGPITDLSEQFLLSCNLDGWSCETGGYTAHKYHYNTLAKDQSAIGAAWERDFVYQGITGTCGGLYVKPFRLSGWQFVTGSERDVATVDQIKAAIYKYGPVTAGVCAGDAFERYGGGVFATNETFCTFGGRKEPGTNHQIILVGWDDSTQSWILRNSYGTNWGEGGYMNIRWGTSRVGEGTSWVAYTPPMPTAAELVSPMDVNLLQTRPVFSWKAVRDAVEYEVRAWTGDQPSTALIAVSYTCADGVCSGTPDEALALGDYHWSVTSVNLFNRKAVSQVADFGIASASSRAILPAVLTGEAEPIYLWEAVPGAAGYQLEVQTQAGAQVFTEPVSVTACGTRRCQARPENALAIGKYRWRVTVSLDGVQQPPITWQAFEVMNLPFDSWMPMIGREIW